MGEGGGGGEIAKESSLADQNQNGLKKTHPPKKTKVGMKRTMRFWVAKCPNLSWQGRLLGTFSHAVQCTRMANRPFKAHEPQKNATWQATSEQVAQWEPLDVGLLTHPNRMRQKGISRCSKVKNFFAFIFVWGGFFLKKGTT